LLSTRKEANNSIGNGELIQEDMPADRLPAPLCIQAAEATQCTASTGSPDLQVQPQLYMGLLERGWLTLSRRRYAAAARSDDQSTAMVMRSTRYQPCQV
jgi:hypothetical protein